MDDEEGGYRRGAPRRLSSPDRRSGKNLDDVIRDILHAVMTEQGWGQKETARKLRCGQGSISRKLKGEGPGSGFWVEEVAHLCNALDVDPIALLQKHPLYTDESRAARTFPKDHLYHRYNALLRNADARGLLRDLQEARELGVFDRCIEAVRLTLETAQEAVDEGRKVTAKKRRKSAPRRRSKEIGA